MTSRKDLPAPDVLLVRYGELALKGGNRRAFELALARNIQHAAKPVSPVVVERHQGRLQVVPERRPYEVAQRIRDVFGIKSVSPAWAVAPDPDTISEMARLVLAEALAECPSVPATVRIRTRRADKRFPLGSSDFDRYVAERILPGEELAVVKLVGAEIEIGIEIRDEGTWVFHQRLPGPGGLPVGTLGRAICLLSGGIDSPVAAWMAMKRGCRVGFVTFHSYPYIGESSKKKVLDLVGVLARYQDKSRVFVVPFTEVQVAIRDNAPEGYRTVLYRRMMQRIASRLATEHEYQVAITGECMGQVASQTLENMQCIEEASEIPVLRPLITFDKEEVIAVAERIGTFSISKTAEPDCCTVFQPRRPVIRGRLKDCHAAEREIDVEGLVARAVAGAEILTVEAQL